MRNSFDLQVSVPADEWAYMQRRAKYLETLLIRLVRDQHGIQEFYTAAEIAAKRLAGLPTTPDAVGRKARKERWVHRRAKFRGTWFHSYHVSSLPSRAFDDLLSRILAMPDINAVVPVLPNLPVPPAPSRPQPINTAPPWVLPLMRIMKTETNGNLGEAWEVLPERLPPNVPLPSVEEAAAILVQFGIAGT